MTLVKEYPVLDEPQKDLSLSLPHELIKSLCFNCDNRSHCKWKEERKIYCEHFE